MIKRLAFVLLCALALCAGDWSAVDAAQPLPSEVEAEPIVPLESFTSESGWLARWQADHQRRAAKDGWIQTDRPSFTLSDATVPKGWIQLESGYTYSDMRERIEDPRGLPPYYDVKSHTLPELSLRWGLTNWAELRVLWGGVRENTQTVSGRFGSYTVSYTETADVGVGVKLQVSEQRGWIPKSAFTTDLFVPTSNYYNIWVPVIDYIYTWSLTDRVSLGGSTGAVFANLANQIAINEFFQSAILRYHWSPQVSLFIEWYTMVRNYDGATWYPFTDLGIQWRPLANLQFDWRIGIPVGDVTDVDGLFTGVGVSVRY
jgi:hypothetical protein